MQESWLGNGLKTTQSISLPYVLWQLTTRSGVEWRGTQPIKNRLEIYYT